MKKVTYKPKDELFKGEVEIHLPSARQRLRYLKECSFKANDEGAISTLENVDAMEAMFTVAEKHVKKVTLKHTEGGAYKTFKQMSEDAYCDDICQEIIQVVLEGKLGEG